MSAASNGSPFLEASEDAQVKVLEMRIHHLEETRKLRAKYYGDCCPCATAIFSFLWNLFWSIPYVNISALSLSFIGANLCYGHEDVLLKFFHRLKIYPEVKEAMYSWPYIMPVVLFVDVFSVLAAIPTTGSLREWFFERKSEAGCCVGFLQMLAGHFSHVVILIILSGFFVAFFVGVLAAIPAVFVVSLTRASCQLDDIAVKSSLAHSLGHVPDQPQGRLDAYTKFAEDYIVSACHEDYDLLYECARAYTLGLTLIALGQAWQAVMTINSFAKIISVDVSASQEPSG